MKVLHLLQSNRFSGAENVVCQIIGMFKDVSDVEMVYSSRDGQIREILAEKNISFAPVQKLSVKEVKRVIKEQKPHIIHAHDMNASFVAACACKKIPIVSHIHNNNFDSRGLSAKSVAYMLAAIKAKHIFWVSQSSFDGYAFHKMFGKKSAVLYNIIDVNALRHKMESDSRTYDYDVLYVGRLTYQKDPQRLIRVFERVVQKLPSVKIGIVGTGDLEEETRALCNKLNLNDNVEFLGFQSNPLKMLYNAKTMVMTSRWEGTPMCALEAMALGVPIVSTPTDGLCELVSDGVNGYLNEDDEILADKIVDIITNKPLYEKLSENTTKYSKEINDVGSYKKTLIEVYENTKK